ncbi:MAG: STAS domain-containing protein [Chloroflexi bacterium]|nr:STAS domain-containing protein [Chloroflexota bacterium]MYK61075.1 STAS domain-containing protein [Chloroflexota bacterium]
MEISTERVGNALIVMPSENRVDGTNARDFQVGLEAAIEETDSAVIFDAETLTYISSAGLRAILLVVKSINRRGGKFAVCSLSDPIREIFSISGFDNIIPIEATRDEALAAIG